MFVLDWINHASYRASNGRTVLVTDPWLEGTAFNNSWALLAPTRFTYEEFGEVTHMWVSHEHPDHFSPPVLRRIPEDIRQRITFMHRATRDRRVVAFAKKLGFRIMELLPGRRYSLGPDFEVVCGVVGSDSWLLMVADGCAVLNVNDCILVDRSAIARIRDSCPRIDILLTQFSYAVWAGNEDEPHRQIAAAKEKLDAIALQIEVLRPRTVIPFASFIWFAHEENRFMNDHVNRIGDVHAFLQRCGVESVVMFPGDRWEPGMRAGSLEAIERYARCREESQGRAPQRAMPVATQALLDLSREYTRRLRDKNWVWTLRPLRACDFLRPVRIHVPDCETTFAFDMFDGLQLVSGRSSDAEIAMSSEALAFCLRHDYGFDTTLIGGRFRDLGPGGHRLLSRHFALARRNASGLHWPTMILHRG